MKEEKYSAVELQEKVNDAFRAITYDRQPQSLYDPIRYVLSLGGKRIRPVLMLLSYSMFRDNPDSIMPQALGIETYHNFTLLHDDLMDNADLRRGHPTVHRRWNANTAILSGDTMLILAYRYMQQCDALHLPRVMSLFTETTLQIDEGQQYDIDFETRHDVTVDEYIEMIRLKTSVLLACALKIGAIMADASDGDADLLYQYGEHIGLAFQLQDDLLDVYGDPQVFGKAIGGDILSNKKTFLLITALQQASATQRAELDRWLQATSFDPQEKITAVTRLYDDIGVRQKCEELIRSYYDAAQKLLSQVSVSDEQKKLLQQYTTEMMGRQY